MFIFFLLFLHLLITVYELFDNENVIWKSANQQVKVVESTWQVKKVLIDFLFLTFFPFLKE